MYDLFAPWHLIILTPILATYLIPAIVSGARKTKHFWWIFAINFFLGWTVVGWIVALVWALRDEPKYIYG